MSGRGLRALGAIAGFGAVAAAVRWLAARRGPSAAEPTSGEGRPSGLSTDQEGGLGAGGSAAAIPVPTIDSAVLVEPPPVDPHHTPTHLPPVNRGDISGPRPGQHDLTEPERPAMAVQRAGTTAEAGRPATPGRLTTTLDQASFGQRGATGQGVDGQRGDMPDKAAEVRGSDTPAKEGGIFYGWVLVAVVFFILTVSSGLGFYNASVILAAATDELNASVGAVSGATGLFFAVSGLTGFLFSRRLDEVDIRWFFAIGSVIGAAALAGLRLVETVSGLYVFFALFGVGFAMAGLVPATTLVTRWFDRRRSVALSIASTGLSLGGIVLTPVSAWLIDRRGLGGASLWLAALWFVGIAPLALLFLRSNPADRGLRPDGAAPRPTDTATATDQTTPSAQQAPAPEPPLPGLDFLSARRTRFFIALCFAYAVIFFGQVGAIAQLFNMVKERTDIATASTCLSVLAFTSVVARLVGGALVSRISTKPFAATLAVAQAGGLVALALAPSSTTLIVSSALFGISVGNLLMLQPLLLAEAFGVANYGRIYGFNQLFGTIGVAGGPYGLGVLRDQFDYEVAFFVAAAASLAGFVFMVLAGPPRRVQRLWGDG